MSLIYEVCLKKEEYKIPQGSSFYKQLLRAYNDLQMLRDDSIWVEVTVDLNEKFLREQRNKRIKELQSPPFGAIKEQWMK